MRTTNLTQVRDHVGNHLLEIRGKHLKVLIVDDEPLWRRSMRFNLTKLYDAEVQQAASGEEAIKILETGKLFDVIFLDLSMPIMTGTQTFAQLRAIDPSGPIVMMSAYSDGEEWAKASRLGVELLSKPIDDEELEEVLLKVKSR